LSWVTTKAIGVWRYFGSEEQPTPQLVQRAVETVKLWDQIADAVQRMEAAAKLSGQPMGKAARTRWARAVGWLAMTAQPVAVVREAYMEGGAQESLAGIGFEPTSGMVTGAIAAVIVLSVVAGLAYLAYQHAAAVEIQAEMQQAFSEQAQPLVQCVSNMKLSVAERTECRKALETLKPAEQPKSPLESLTELATGVAPYAAGLAALGLGAYYIGPVIRQASEAGAGEIERLRQRRARVLQTG